MLTHRGIDAWLKDKEGNILAHSPPQVEGYKISAIVQAKPKTVNTPKYVYVEFYSYSLSKALLFSVVL